MSRITRFENIMKEKRAHTPFRKYLYEIASWIPLVLYKRKEDISRYPDTPRAPRIVHGKLYDASRDDLLLVGREYDFSKDFFTNYGLLSSRIPLPSRMIYANAENCDYAESAWMSKSVYLSILAISDCENILYTFYVQDNVKNVLNSVMVWDHSENVYFSTAVIQGYQVFYSKYIVNSSNIWFSTNLVGCRECILCDGFENTEYAIENTKYPKEVYFEKKTEILRNKALFHKRYESLQTEGKNFGSTNVEGQFCIYSEDVTDGFFSYRVKNAHNIFFVGDKGGRTNVYDTLCSDQAGDGDLYGCVNLGSASNCYFSDSFIGQSLYYSFNCIECSFCLGCIGLQNKSFCILNKQYSKEDWEILAEKIFAQMEGDGSLGKFFPASMNPFYFNDSMAQLIDSSFTKEEVESAGYLWRDEPIKVDIPEGLEVVKSTELDQFHVLDEAGIWEIDSSILDKVIIDEKGNYYRIVKMEYDFLLKYGLPLPTMHWHDRMKMGFNI